MLKLVRLVGFSLFFLASTSQGGPRRALEQAKPWLGVSIDSGIEGVIVKSALPGTPAEKSGLKSGDVITSIDDVRVIQASEMIELIQSKGVGHTVKLKFLRNGKTEESSITLVARPDMVELAKTQLMDKKAPDFKLERATGKDSGKLADHLGKVVLLQFWATWCPACLSTHPELAAAAQKQAANGLVVLAISDEDSATISGYVKRSKADFTSLVDAKGEVSAMYGVPALPTMVVVDRRGIVRHVGIGGGTYMTETLTIAEKLLAEKE